MASPPIVLIVGCGVAGPVLGNFFKRKGYSPIVFEKVPELGDAGASLMLFSNGMKVLNLLGIADQITEESCPLQALIDSSFQGNLLGESRLPSAFKDKYMQPAAGIKRTSVCLMLNSTLTPLGVDVRQGWELDSVTEDSNSVTATFKNGQSVTGSFLVGCDGIKSATRTAIRRMQGVSEMPPTYTGLTQTAGISKTPESFQNTPALRNWYGDGVHFISYPVSVTHSSWAITQRENQETQESWRPYQSHELPAQKKTLGDLLQGWDQAAMQMVQASERIIKFGLFDRTELLPSEWYSKRCVLVGDAAHPTSPHLGQGANQALEDCFHLSHALPTLGLADESHSKGLAVLGETLSETIFKPYAEKRQPRTSELVKGARAQGNNRVASGEETQRKRDAAIVAGYKDQSAMAKKFDSLLCEPFQTLP